VVGALTATVFAAVPSYYFRGFGGPVEPDTLIIAKPGRGIPPSNGRPTPVLGVEGSSDFESSQWAYAYAE
jgi:hypothetical protein